MKMLTNAAKANEDCPYYFLHIPKTAGTTLNGYLQQQFGETLFPGWGWHQILGTDTKKLSKYRIFSGHFYGKLQTAVTGNFRYFTFLRDPIERALSHYGHVIRDKTHYCHDRAVALGSFGAYLRDPEMRETISNIQVKALVQEQAPFEIAKYLKPEVLLAYELDRRLETLPLDGDPAEILQLAKSRLDQFCFVGITEQFNESLRLLCKTFQWPFPYELTALNENAQNMRNNDLLPEDMCLLKEINKLDIELYSYATARFEAAYAKALNLDSTIETVISYAQNFEDVMLRRAFKGVKQGFYIDVGAWEPDKDSVTRLFYESGWRGINVEPNPDVFPRLEQKRQRDINIRKALGKREGELLMNFVDNSGLSTLDSEIAKSHEAKGFGYRQELVEITTLGHIWEEFVPKGQQVHFLKIDVEGAEAEIINSFAWTKCRPWILVVEATRPMSQEESHADWEPALLNSGYQLVYLDGLNRFYLAHEHENLLTAFKYPPNVFDNFIVATQYRAETVARQAEEQRKQLEGLVISIHQSASWRITRPLRVLGRILRGEWRAVSEQIRQRLRVLQK